MATPDLGKYTPLIDGPGETPRPRRFLTGRRLVACIAVLTVILTGFAISHPGICGHLGSVPGRGASLWTDKGAKKEADSGKELGNGLLTTKRQETGVASARAPEKTVLECFQVAQPVLTPDGATYFPPASGEGSSAGSEKESPSAKESCTVLLMEHTFGWSYDKPFIGNYEPPDCDFNRVVMNFTVTSQGRQFDRLALMYLGDTEVWRTSTAEPTPAPGIRWEYYKDMTQYLYFWKTPQKVIFDLGNLVDDTYTGSFNTTLTATFFSSDVETEAAPPSDLIIPISKRNSSADAVSQFTVPKDNATNTIDFPRNARRAVFSVSACGQADEEFWWSNVMQSDTLAFNESGGGEWPGWSPFREVQVLIDGEVAGVQWPFPVIFTGGVVPGLHRPVAGIDAFDLREHEIDITPFLPLLCDGKEHTFTIRIAGLNDDGKSTAELTETVNDSWYVTGKIFVWLDEDEDSITTGDAPTIEGGAPVITFSREIGQSSNGTNETLTFTTEVKRTFTTSGKVVTQKSSDDVSWTQTLSYVNKGLISGFGANQLSDLVVEGTDETSGRESYSTDYRYPVFANITSSISDQGNLTLEASLSQGLRLRVRGSAVFPTGLEAFPGHGGDSLLDTTKDGTAYFYQYGDGSVSTGFGSSAQKFTFGTAGGGDDGEELFFRDVSFVNGTVVHDHVRVAGRSAEGGEDSSGSASVEAMIFAPAPAGGGTGPRVFMGRGAVGKV